VLWRRSLQVRVVTSTLALSTAVVFVLGMVLQNEIIDRLVATKQAAAIAQTAVAQRTVTQNLRGVNSSTDDLPARLAGALSSLTSVGSIDSGQQLASSAAGGFVAVLAADGLGVPAPVQAVGPYGSVPDQLRRYVQGGRGGYQIATVPTDTGQQTFIIVGAPITSANPPLQLYLLFSLSSEQNTIGVVEGTLVIGGLVLVLLLAGITNLVIRQVVRPVRTAAGTVRRGPPRRADAGDRRGRCRSAGRVVQPDGREYPGADPPAGGLRPVAAPVLL
jgi:two-component system, OmpR family, sensor histidine kinase MtrB